MHFLHPTLLIGALGAAVPLLAHLLSPRARRTIHFAPIALLPDTQVAAAGRNRAHHLVLLVLRMLLVALLAAYLARPTFEAPPAAPLLAAMGPQVIVIDASGSMNYATPTGRLLHRARQCAHQQVAALAAGTQVALLVVPKPQNSPGTLPLTDDHAMVHEAIERLVPVRGRQSADLSETLARAAALVAQEAGRATLWVISDLAASSLPVPVAQVAWPHVPPEVHFLDVASRALAPGAKGLGALANVAITAITSGSGPTVTVDVHNYGDAPVLARGLTLQVHNQPAQRALVDLGAQQGAAKVFAVAAGTPERAQVVATLDGGHGDGYDADDSLAQELLFAPSLRVLLVDGSPKATQAQTELHYLERALSQVPEGENAISLAVATRSGLLAALREAQQKPFDVLVLANVGGLIADEAQALRAARKRGTGLLVALGDQIVLQGDRDAAAYAEVMPLELRDLAQDTTSGAQSMEGRVLGAIAQDHPVFSDLAPASLGALRQARTGQFIYVVARASQGAQVLAAFDNGAPALIEMMGVQGEGAGLLWTSTLDADWTDLPMRGVFVPWVQALVRRAGMAEGARARGLGDAGSPRVGRQDVSESDFAVAQAAVLQGGAATAGTSAQGLGAHNDVQAQKSLNIAILVAVWLLAAAEAWLAYGPRAGWGQAKVGLKT